LAAAADRSSVLRVVVNIIIPADAVLALVLSGITFYRQRPVASGRRLPMVSGSA
jgi:hypothetical protein